MEKDQYKLCAEVFSRLDAAGILRNCVLIGSWCIPFYKDYFSGISYQKSIKTRDIDFITELSQINVWTAPFSFKSLVITMFASIISKAS